MCRNIKLLFNFDPPATDAEVRAAAVQFVRKVSGFTHRRRRTRRPSIARSRGGGVGAPALGALVTNAPSRSREEEARPRQGSAP